MTVFTVFTVLACQQGPRQSSHAGFPGRCRVQVYAYIDEFCLASEGHNRQQVKSDLEQANRHLKMELTDQLELQVARDKDAVVAPGQALERQLVKALGMKPEAGKLQAVGQGGGPSHGQGQGPLQQEESQQAQGWKEEGSQSRTSSQSL